MRKYVIKNCNRHRDWVFPGNGQVPYWLSGLYIKDVLTRGETTDDVYEAKSYKTYAAANKQAGVLNGAYGVKKYGYFVGYEKFAPDFVVVGIDIVITDCTVGGG